MFCTTLAHFVNNNRDSEPTGTPIVKLVLNKQAFGTRGAETPQRSRRHEQIHNSKSSAPSETTTFVRPP